MSMDASRVGITVLCIGIYIFHETGNYVCIKFFRLDSYIEINLIILKERTEKVRNIYFYKLERKIDPDGTWNRAQIKTKD